MEEMGWLAEAKVLRLFASGSRPPTRRSPPSPLLGTSRELRSVAPGWLWKYKPQPKPEKRCHWGSRLLPKVLKAREKKKRSPGQMRLPWDEWEATNSEIREVAEKFVMANCYDPKVAAQFFNDS